ncbi:FxLYD domain-containing protein [Chloroflexota bacterium]
MKKGKLYLIAITVLVVAFLFTLLVSCSPKAGENTINESGTSRVPSASREDAAISAPDMEEEKLTFVSKRGYISETGCPTIVGEVENSGDFVMKDILITASFYCSKGKEVGGKEDIAAISSYAEIEILAPGETSPFKNAISVEELKRLENFDVDKIERYKVVGEYNATDEEQLYKSFEIYQSRGELDDTTGHYQVVGEVKNIGNETVKQIKIVGAFYDMETRIIEVVHTYIQEQLHPGDEAQFEITVLDKTIAKRIKTSNIQAVEYEKGS